MMESLKESIGFVLMIVVASVPWIVVLIFLVGLAKLSDWRRDYLQLVKRVAELEARLSAVTVTETPQR